MLFEFPSPRKQHKSCAIRRGVSLILICLGCSGVIRGEVRVKRKERGEEEGEGKGRKGDSFYL